MKSFTRVISVILLFAIIVSSVSCSKREPEYDGSIRVEIARDDVNYSDEFVTAAEARYKSIAVSLIEYYFDVALNSSQISRITAQFKLNIIPMLYRVKIYEDELDEIFDGIESRLGSEDIPSIPSLLYDTAFKTLGAERFGQMLFGTYILLLENKAADAREKYKQYGYRKYLEDAERCTALTEGLREMNEYRFTDAVSIFTSLVSLGAGIQATKDDGAFLLDEKSVLYVLDYRNRMFAEVGITDSEWVLIGSVHTELIPARATDLYSSMLYEMKKIGYLNGAARTMPQVIDLYASVISFLREISDFSLSEDENENAALIARALIGSEEELSSLCTSLAENAVTSEESQRKIIVKHLGEEALSEYTAITYEELLLGLNDVASGKENAAKALEDLTRSYLYGIAPYFTIAFFTPTEETAD